MHMGAIRAKLSLREGVFKGKYERRESNVSGEFTAELPGSMRWGNIRLYLMADIYRCSNASSSMS